MNKTTKIIPILALLGANGLVAQSLSFTTYKLESGKDLQADSVYRFDNVLNGVDALIKVNSISANATLNQLDDRSGTGKDFSAFRPIIGGVSPDRSNKEHEVSFTISFVAADTRKSVTLNNFSLSIFDTDGDNDLADSSLDREDGNVIEFARLDGNLDMIGSKLQKRELALGMTEIRAITSETNPGVTDTAGWRSDWSYGDANSFNVTLGWAGTDFINDADNDRLYGAYFSGNTQVVPEPSSTALLGLGVFGILIRRKRL